MMQENLKPLLTNFFSTREMEKEWSSIIMDYEVKPQACSPSRQDDEDLMSDVFPNIREAFAHNVSIHGAP